MENWTSLEVLSLLSIEIFTLLAISSLAHVVNQKVRIKNRVTGALPPHADVFALSSEFSHLLLSLFLLLLFYFNFYCFSALNSFFFLFMHLMKSL